MFVWESTKTTFHSIRSRRWVIWDLTSFDFLVARIVYFFVAAARQETGWKRFYCVKWLTKIWVWQLSVGVSCEHAKSYKNWTHVDDAGKSRSFHLWEPETELCWAFWYSRTKRLVVCFNLGGGYVKWVTLQMQRICLPACSFATRQRRERVSHQWVQRKKIDFPEKYLSSGSVYADFHLWLWL